MTDQGTPAPVTPVVPPGWHINPATGQRQWWTGVDWAPLPPPKPTPQPLAVFSLVAGAVAFLFGLVPVLGLLLALGAGVLAIFALTRKATPKWMTLAGLGGAAVAFLTSLIVLVSLAGGANQGLTPVAGPSSSPTSETKPTPKPTPVPVPDVVGKTVAEANAILLAAGFDSASNGEADWVVTAQDPAAAAEALTGTVIALTAKRDFSAYVKLSKRDFAQMAKNPASFAGRQIIMYGNVWQFDSATGPCNLLANTAYKKQAYSFDYDVNTWVEVDDCSILDPVVEDDNVALWVTVVGAYDYETAIGGTNTAVRVQVDKVKILPATEY